MNDESKRCSCLVLGLLMLASGCAVGPNYKRPKVDLPEHFRFEPIPAGTNSLAELPWWEVFKDPTLQELIRVAFTNNYDLRIAIARVEQSRAVLEQNRALFLPQLDYQAGVARGKNSTVNNPVPTGGNTVNFFSAVGNASWEIDLWGRIRRLNEAARAQLLASQEMRRDIMVTVLSDVATTYFELLSLDSALEIARRTTNT